MQKQRRKLIFIGAIVIVVVGAAYLWSRNGSDKVSYRTEKIDRGDIVVNISATGTLNAGLGDNFENIRRLQFAGKRGGTSGAD